MRKSLKTSLIIVLMLGIFLFLSEVSIADEPSIEIDPTSPTAESTVSFTAEISDEEVISVWLKCQECNRNIGICYTPGFNVSMDQIGTAYVYNTDVTLTHSDTTYIKYWVEVETESGWTKYSVKEIDLSETSVEDNVENDSGNSPGFELFIALSSVIFILWLYNKKRMK